MRYAASIALMFLLMVGITEASDAPVELVLNRSEMTVRQSLDQTLKFADENGATRAWVFFTDKGFSSDDIYYDKLNEVENSLTEKAKTRRMKTRDRFDLVDYYDIPVYEPYIEQVLATGVKVRRVLKWFNAVTIEGDADQLNDIAAMPFVCRFKHIVSRSLPDGFDRTMNESTERPLLSSTLDYGASQWQNDQINSVVAHELGITGQNVLICMMDTGYRQGHIAFQDAINEGRLITQYDFINDDDNTDYDPEQDEENQIRHGTLTWSTLGGQSSGNLYGPAYGANFVLAKTEDITGEYHGEEDNWAAAAEWCDSLGVDVISASLGYRYRFDPPDDDYPYEWMNGDSTIVSIAADLAAARGITIATAQGNDGSEGDGSLIAPADCDSVLAVGAVDYNDEIASFSGLGPTFDGRTKPEVCALGSGTVCADPADLNDFATSSGTSLSTPLVGGACGILLSAHPNWSPMMVREALMMTATNPEDPCNVYGTGIIDVGKALFYHPEGDMIIEHQPIIYFPPGLDNITADVTITGGAGVSHAYFHMRLDEQDDFEATEMYGSNDIYEGIIPGLDDGYVQYYFSVEDNNGITITYPYNASENYFTVYVDSTAFNDSFENGLYYWKTEGTNGNWTICSERTHTGTIALTDSPYRDYRDNAEYIITSNFEINLYDARSATASFYARHILQSNMDYVYFEVSTDGGEHWNMPGPLMTGSQMNFLQTTVDLSDYIDNSVMFRFRMVTDGSTVRDGVYIDDFEIVWDTQTDIQDDGNQLPSEFSLAQNYPNPFNPTTMIKFEIPRTSEVELVVYDILGQKVQTVVSETMEAGTHEAIWNGADDNGNEVASGMYFYKLTAGDHTQLKRMTLIR